MLLLCAVKKIEDPVYVARAPKGSIRCEITNHITGLKVYLSIEDGISDIFCL